MEKIDTVKISSANALLISWSLYMHIGSTRYASSTEVAWKYLLQVTLKLLLNYHHLRLQHIRSLFY